MSWTEILHIFISGCWSKGHLHRIEAGIVADGSINGVLDGKHYNRALRVHKCIHEALLRLAWEVFMLLVEDNIQDMNVVIKTLLD